MKDLDFDELDRAVNTLMSDVEAPTPAPESEENSVELASLPSEPAAASVEPQPAAPLVKEPTSLARRRSGRFMDVVHPSSDMRTSSMTTPPSRQGITIAPRAAMAVPEEPAPSFEPTTPSRDSAQASTPEATTTWQNPTDASEDEPVVDDEPEYLSTPVSSGEPAGLTSPFLPDTKVEKRPLGGKSIDDEIAAELSKELSETFTAEDDTTTSLEPASDVAAPEQESAPETESLPPSVAEPEEIKQVLPAELDSDLVAIEAGESVTDKNTPSTPVAAPSRPASLVAGSIPQQYTEQPSTGDATHAPIYDSEEVHQPLAHPAKKKSGWLWVIWILVILALGAGAGAAVFFFYLI